MWKRHRKKLVKETGSIQNMFQHRVTRLEKGIGDKEKDKNKENW